MGLKETNLAKNNTVKRLKLNPVIYRQTSPPLLQNAPHNLTLTLKMYISRASNTNKSTWNIFMSQ